MAALVVIRSLSLVASGAFSYELYRQTYLPVRPLQRAPQTIVVQSEKKDSYSKLVPLGVLSGVIFYYMYKHKFVSFKQLKKVCDTLETQISSVSKTMVRFKDSVFKKFGNVEKRLDDIENTILSKTSEIKRDIANVESMIVNINSKINQIEMDSSRAACGVTLLCGAVVRTLGTHLTEDCKNSLLKLTDKN
jgi:hypothetical protein